MLQLTLIDEQAELADLVEHVFADAEVRRGMGWTEADDTDEAMTAIHGLFERRHEAGWRLYRVTDAGETVGLAGRGPVDPDDASAWFAVYLRRRGEGLGCAVTERLAAEAADAGARELVAVTWAENTASQGLLEATGFELVGPAPYDWARESELDWRLYRRAL